ncbi:hypothetical protein [Azohydromonas aeria]|uniref:hypothetical protein n=1 Tax=Azohydromonas aeria TaxID=2590212 RepID=UPI0012F818A7|nr:hypothetical protein [Azohydromonas aeria]
MRLKFWMGPEEGLGKGADDGGIGAWKPPFRKDPLTQQAERSWGSWIFAAWWLMAIMLLVWTMASQLLNIGLKISEAVGELLEISIR